MAGKIILRMEDCWIIRGYSLNDAKKQLFHVVANEWNSAPTKGTIYRSEESALRFIDDMRYHNRVGFGAKDIVEAVPLEGAIHSIGKAIIISKENPNG